jgi:hypothetical protein
MSTAEKFLLIAVLAVGLLGAGAALPVQAQTVMQQCGQQFQAAKAANTLNGMSWNQFRTECAARLKAQPAALTPAPTPTIVPAPATTIANPLKPVTPAPAIAVPAPAAPSAVTAATPMAPLTGGRAAFVNRERQCGAEWRTQKVALTAQTPGLTWPRYLSQCNARLKAAGQ